jgi:crotonobetainyl-CoA:carnitine CoA-transferase CaiB-like acyl-CoA transferase
MKRMTARRDGDVYVIIMCMSDKFWLELLKALELEVLAADARFADGNTRHRHRAELTAAPALGADNASFPRRR